MERITRARPRPILVRYSKFRIAVTAGPDAGAFMDIAGATLRVGSSPENDLVLRDDSISRHHCELTANELGVRVRDLGSTNGILLHDVRVDDFSLNRAATLQLGDTTVTVTPLAERVEREQTAAPRFGDLIGGSPRMRELFADLERIAASDVSLLIEGETGTGKDLVAESVHRVSPRASGPFVVFDCGAVAPSLAESELFGHERGAFTGAVATTRGVFEQAERGTLFLDELGELPRELQPKLLRVIERRQFRRLGGSSTMATNVRIIAATNRNLLAEVRQGTFREDLYFRIAATRVSVPPLRERLEDLPMLVQHLLARECHLSALPEVPDVVWEMFRSYRWPGNVRELKNAVQRLIVTPDRVAEGLAWAEAEPAAGTGSDRQIPPLRVARRDAADRFERTYLQTLLGRTNGHVTRAAAIAEVSRQMIQRLLRKHDLGRRELA